MLSSNKIYQGDCQMVMHNIDSDSVDLIIADSPYNINKAKWDRWKDKEKYLNWCVFWIKECERILKDNGSFYFFHNNVPIIAQLMNKIDSETKFIFKQFIVWNKRFNEAHNKGYLNGFIVVDGLRNYQQMAEYILYYTFQDETGLKTVCHDTNNFSTLRKYFYDLLCYIGETNKDISKRLGHRKAEHSFYVMPKLEVIKRVGQRADHCFRYGSTQWAMPTCDVYNELIRIYKINEWGGFREYESLREEYESLRYTFNNQKTHHSVWNYEIAPKKSISPLNL